MNCYDFTSPGNPLRRPRPSCQYENLRNDFSRSASQNTIDLFAPVVLLIMIIVLVIVILSWVYYSKIAKDSRFVKYRKDLALALAILSTIGVPTSMLGSWLGPLIFVGIGPPIIWAQGK